MLDIFNKNFNPLPRKEGDSNEELKKMGVDENFNPLPRKEGDGGNLRRCEHCGISIHSLVKRETFYGGKANNRERKFNPLPRKEGDMPKIEKAIDYVSISIHSLVKRETP